MTPVKGTYSFHNPILPVLHKIYIQLKFILYTPVRKIKTENNVFWYQNWRTEYKVLFDFNEKMSQ